MCFNVTPKAGPPVQPSAPAPLTQLPFAQTWPIAHALPHAPQLASLCFRSTHTSLQSCWFAAQPHTPATHAAPVAHGLLQPPQCSTLVWVSTHAPLQAP